MLERLENLIEETSKQMGCELIEFNGEHDHVHIIVSVHPKLAVSNWWFWTTTFYENFLFNGNRELRFSLTVATTYKVELEKLHQFYDLIPRKHLHL